MILVLRAEPTEQRTHTEFTREAAARRMAGVYREFL